MARRNGWQAPFHVLQVLTWVVFPSLMALFFAFYTPLLATTTAYLGSVAYGLACLFTIYSVVVCTRTDPSDDCILRPSTINRDTRAGDDQVYCNVCMQYVHKESRHCRLCDKCVAVFDHHCKWLNNCVGQKNYKYFLGSVIGATTLLALQIALGVYLFWEAFAHPDTLRARSASAFGCSKDKDPATGLCVDESDDHLSLLAIKLVHGVLLGFLVPWCFLIAQLMLFHMHLCIENITTYDYIVRKRKRQMNRERGGDNSSHSNWFQLLCTRMCRKRGAVNGAHHASDGDKTHNASHHSGGSLPSEEEELAAIEAEVDDDLEVVSLRSSSGSVHSQRQGKERDSFAPARGFGMHVNLASVVTGGGSAAAASSGLSGVAPPIGAILGAGSNDSINTPTAYLEADYVAAPHTPRSPRSENESAYLSDDSADGNRPLPGIKLTSSSSMVMYGRPRPSDAAVNHIV